MLENQEARSFKITELETISLGCTRSVARNRVITLVISIDTEATDNGIFVHGSTRET